MNSTESNIFIENSEAIKEHFIVSFVGEPNIKKYYVQSSLPQEWIRAFRSNKKKVISKSHYEKRLISYFENPTARNSNHPLILLAGGVGSGKSSSLRYAMHKANICKGCQLENSCKKNYPDRIIVDFLKFMKNADHEAESQEDYEVTADVYELFWQHIINILDESINNEMTFEREVKEFWPWLVNYKNKHYSFYNFIDTYRDEILNEQTNLDRLRKLRHKLRSQLSRKHLAYYKLFHIAFMRKDRSVKCNFLLFDNIDTLPPVLQTDLVHFSEEAFHRLNSKSILLVRPMTYLRNRDASNFIEKIEHSKASLKDVFLERLKRLKNDELFGKDSRIKNAESLISCLEKAINLFPSSRTYSDVFVSTSGRSIRYGLKNFYNFLLSPHIITHRDNRELDQIKLDHNTFFQAYFCGENALQRLDENNFVNLISIRHSETVQELSNIKLRILDIMIRQSIMQTNELVSLLEGFGYRLHDIHKSLNDLLKNRKALIWSSHVSNYYLNELKKSEHHSIRLTDLGYRYYNKLITYLNYIRECIIPIEGRRHYGQSKNFQNIYKYLQDLEDLDMKQIERFVLNRGLVNYEILYSNLYESLSLTIWKKVSEPIKTLSVRHPEIIIDNEKENEIIKKTKLIIKNAEKRRQR